MKMEVGKMNLVLIFILLAVSVVVAPSVYQRPQDQYLQTKRERLPEEIANIDYKKLLFSAFHSDINKKLNGELAPLVNAELPKVKPLMSSSNNTTTTSTTTTTTTTTEDELESFCRSACPNGDGGEVCECAKHPIG
ncbi:UNVERIFIED_CONTAM: hypothetical protein RMT77_016931 [Armadillidium vulgare]